jgi:hypothetical protein
MSEELNYREIYSLTLEVLRSKKFDQFLCVKDEVEKEGARKKIFEIPPDTIQNGALSRSNTDACRAFEKGLSELVRQAFWECLIKGILIFGKDSDNPEWPFYRLTAYGEKIVNSQKPQPYDPDGFIAFFNSEVPDADDVVVGYLEEAVQSFNHGCCMASAVMLGCASEKLILLLTEATGEAIEDDTKKEDYLNKIKKARSISRKWTELKNTLDLIAKSKDFPFEQKETIASELPAGYELLRRCRNSAGHPDVPGNVTPEVLFMNLRLFTEYARRVGSLISWFENNAVDW